VPILSDLNEPQRAAVTHPGGPLLVIAGAGTGKTHTLASRVAYLIESGTPPQRILLLTFSRRAAREMMARAEHLTGNTATGNVWGGTFHAMANRLLRIYGRAIGLQPDFTVLDQADMEDLMNLIRGDLHLDARERRFPRKETLAAIYSRTVNAQMPLTDVVERHFPWVRKEIDAIRPLFQEYTKRKRDQHVLDYDDLLLYWNALAESEAGEAMCEMFDHVLVDEYQDTNVVQAQLLRRMQERIPNVTVVGDDAQSIYSFRAATVQNILQFDQQFPGATIVRLEQNYRSTEPILDVSNAVIALSPQRHEKTLWSSREGAQRPRLVQCETEADQADAVCTSVLEARERGVLLRHQAVLVRAAWHSDLLEVELTRRNIPFIKYGGLKFLEAAHVKDVMSLLRLLENPYDEVSWFRILQLLEGVGPVTARQAIAELQIDAQSGATPIERCVNARPQSLPGSAHEGFAALCSVFETCTQRSVEVSVASQIESIRGFYDPVIERLYPGTGTESRVNDIEQLQHLTGGYKERSAFLTDLTLDPPTTTSDLAGPPLMDEDYLIISTIHSAKGGEWDVVRLLHAADGMIPSDMTTGDDDLIEEERRLLYVALTRARDELEVYYPQRYYYKARSSGDAHGYSQITGFLPRDIRSLFDESVVQQAAPIGDNVGMKGTPASVDRVLQQLWS